MPSRLTALAAVIALTVLLSSTAAAQWVEVNPGSPTTDIYFPRKVGIGSTTAPGYPLTVFGSTSNSILTLRSSDGSGALSANIMSAEWSNLGFSVDRVGGEWIARDPVVGWLVKQSGIFSFYAATGQTVNSAIPLAQVRRLMDINLTSGNVAIGHQPHAEHRLIVAGPAGTTTFPNNPYNMALVDTNPNTTANTGPGLIFGALHTTGQPYTTIASISAVKDSTTAGNAHAALTFGTRGSDFHGGGMSIERMRIRSTGEVVIGPTSGTGQRLTVNGNATVNGTLTGATVIGAVYQDLAEWVPASMDMPPGTVVVLDPRTNNQVMPSHRAYDTTVAGVVSAQPGLILGIPSATKEQIATTGRVRMKVDATAGAIVIGDILVTSGKPGMAMKSQPVAVAGIALHRPGTVVGKALEPLAGGEGEILVLLSLQ